MSWPTGRSVSDKLIITYRNIACNSPPSLPPLSLPLKHTRAVHFWPSPYRQLCYYYAWSWQFLGVFKWLINSSDWLTHTHSGAVVLYVIPPSRMPTCYVKSHTLAWFCVNEQSRCDDGPSLLWNQCERGYWLVLKMALSFTLVAFSCALFIMWYFSSKTIWTEVVEVFCCATDSHIKGSLGKFCDKRTLIQKLQSNLYWRDHLNLSITFEHFCIVQITISISLRTPTAVSLLVMCDQPCKL